MAIAVRFCAGASYLDLQDVHGVSRTACYAFFHQVVDAIVQIADWSDEVSRTPEELQKLAAEFQASTFIRTHRLFKYVKYLFSASFLHSCAPRRRAAHWHSMFRPSALYYSDWQSYFVRVVGNRCYFRPFRIDFPTTRTKCGRWYCRVFLGCNARPSYRIVETSRARVAHPLDPSAGDSPTPRRTTVPREHKC